MLSTSHPTLPSRTCPLPSAREPHASLSRFCIQPLPLLLPGRSFSTPLGTPLPPGLGVRAMANPRRVKMVAQQIRREVGEMLLFDKVIKDKIAPEHALGADLYLSSVATISEVELSGDLQVAKVYVSVYGDERGQELAMAGLKSLAGYVRQGLGRKMRLRFTPEVRFIQDEAIERGSRVLSILSNLERERIARERGESVAVRPSVAPNEDEDDDFFDDFGEFASLDAEVSKSQPKPARPESGKRKKQPARSPTTEEETGTGAKIYLI